MTSFMPNPVIITSQISNLQLGLPTQNPYDGLETTYITQTLDPVDFVRDHFRPIERIAQSFADSAKGVDVNIADATSKILGSKFTAVSSFVEWDNVTGSRFADIIRGADWAETISTGAGNDTIVSSAGADSLDGGAGIDTVDYSASVQNEFTPVLMPFASMEHYPEFGVSVNLTTGEGQWGDAHEDTYQNIENVTGSAQDDFIVGNNVANVLKGGAGWDNLSGGAGNDKLEGGTGNDQLNGGKGSDQLIGGEGIDTAVYSDSTSGVNINLKVGSGVGGDATGDRFTSIENVTGSNFNDTMTGDNNANILDGGNGNDSFSGGLGADTFNGGNGTDTVNYSASSAGVQVNLEAYQYRGGAAPNELMIAEMQKAHVNGRGGDAEGDQLNGIETVIGTNFADNLTGDHNNNTFQGGRGDDYLSGKGGNDILSGGAGNDTFSFGQGYGKDVITDFQAGARFGDKIIFEQVFDPSKAPLTHKELMSHATQEGKNLVFNFNGETLTLNNVTKAQFTADDFAVIVSMPVVVDYPVPMMGAPEPIYGIPMAQ